jgi:hypothetical protein
VTEPPTSATITPILFQEHNESPGIFELGGWNCCFGAAAFVAFG